MDNDNLYKVFSERSSEELVNILSDHNEELYVNAAFQVIEQILTERGIGISEQCEIVTFASQLDPLSPEQIHCSRCNNTIYKDVITCPNCGLVLKEKKIRFSSAMWIAIMIGAIFESVSKERYWYVAIFAAFIIYEFNKLYYYKNLYPDPTNSNTNPSSSKRLVIIGIIALILIGGGAYAYTSGMFSKSFSDNDLIQTSDSSIGDDGFTNGTGKQVLNDTDAKALLGEAKSFLESKGYTVVLDEPYGQPQIGDNCLGISKYSGKIASVSYGLYRSESFFDMNYKLDESGNWILQNPDDIPDNFEDNNSSQSNSTVNFTNFIPGNHWGDAGAQSAIYLDLLEKNGQTIKAKISTLGPAYDNFDQII